MHSRLDEIAAGSTLACDVCIVGSGPAGLAVVSKLLGTARKVILLESGGLEIESDYQELNDGESVGPRELDLTASRLRCFGGAGKLWAGVCRPMSENDFKERPHIQDSGWPIGYSDLSDYYKEAADILKLSYPSFFDGSWKNGFEVARKFAQFDRRNSLLDGLLFQQATFEKRDLTNQYQKGILRSPDVQLITNATVVDLESDGEGEISFVKVKSFQNKEVRIKPKIVVLCAGALENPRIVLNSSVYNDIPHNRYLGACFMSHPGFTNVGSIIRNDVPDCIEKPASSKWGRFFNFEVKAEEQQKSRILRHGISISPDTEKKEVLQNGKTTKDDYWELFSNTRFFNYANRAKCTLLGEGYVENRYWTIDVGIEQQPLLSNKISLSARRDIHGKSMIRAYWGAVSVMEKKTVIEAAKAVGRELMLTSSGVVKLSQKALSGGLFNRQDAINHHIGTTRMSLSVGNGVVDKNLKHHNIGNLFIGGSSVFSTSSVVNPTFTIIALSLRLGDHINTLLKRAG
jgi:choline dehydrogenase-like flavoprotein